MSPAVSRRSEPRIVEFATPKARLFQSLKYGSKSASSALSSVSGRDRMSTSVRHNGAASVQTRAADTSLSHAFNMLSPRSHMAASFSDDNVECDSAGTEFTERLPETTVNSSTSQEDEVGADQVSCCHKSSATRR